MPPPRLPAAPSNSDHAIRDPLSRLPPSALLQFASFLLFPEPRHPLSPRTPVAAGVLSRLARALRETRNAGGDNCGDHGDGRQQQWGEEEEEEEEEYGALCPAHAGLDVDLARFCLRLVKVEVGVRCDVLRAWVNRLGAKGVGPVSADGYIPSSSSSASSASPPPPPPLLPVVEGEIKGNRRWEGEGHRERMGTLAGVLSGIAGLFLGRAEWEEHFVAGGIGWCEGRVLEKAESRCPACVLAVVGGKGEVLVALRANASGRAKGKQPRLLRLVDAWLRLRGPREEAKMKAQSDALAEEVREVRRRMRARKVEKRKKGKEAGPHHDRERGQSRHRGGLPAGTKFVRGVPIPHVKLHHDHRYHNNSYPVNIGLGDTGNRAPSPSQDDVRRGEDNNLFAVDLSPPASPSSIEDDDQSAGEYIPPHKFWYQQGRAGMHG